MRFYLYFFRLGERLCVSITVSEENSDWEQNIHFIYKFSVKFIRKKTTKLN